jgi:AMP-binding enzyme/AMP-binding enzyme C-terminal domain
MITANPLDGPRKAGSVGRPAGTEVRVVGPDGGLLRPCPAGTIGRVQIRGPGVITEYAAGGPADAIDADGWLETGDLGHLDQDGYLFLAGRSDDVINRGGEKIYPREIEEFLLTQPGVRFAVVVAARDEVLGQRPVAYVVPAGSPEFRDCPDPANLADPADLADALREACSRALPRPKRPTEFCLVPELPLGPRGWRDWWCDSPGYSQDRGQLPPRLRRLRFTIMRMPVSAVAPAMAARVPLSPPRPAQRDAAARSMPSATRVAPRRRSSRRRIAARDSQRRARDASSTTSTQ